VRAAWLRWATRLLERDDRVDCGAGVWLAAGVRAVSRTAVA